MSTSEEKAMGKSCQQANEGIRSTGLDDSKHQGKSADNANCNRVHVDSQSTSDGHLTSLEASRAEPKGLPPQGAQQQEGESASVGGLEGGEED